LCHNCSCSFSSVCFFAVVVTADRVKFTGPPPQLFFVCAPNLCDDECITCVQTLMDCRLSLLKGSVMVWRYSIFESGFGCIVKLDSDLLEKIEWPFSSKQYNSTKNNDA